MLIVSNGLNKEQPSYLFNPLQYKTLNDSTVIGYGFVNPISPKSIVFTKEKPTDTLTENWKSIKVKSAKIYTSKLQRLVHSILDLDAPMDSLKRENLLSKRISIDDTLNVVYLRKMKGGIAHGLRSLYYENSKIRLLKVLLLIITLPQN